MWTIARIDEADYGCEERLPGKPLMLLITLEREDGEIIQFEAAENWIEMQGLAEGDEWPEDIEAEDSDAVNAELQSEWMENYEVDGQMDIFAYIPEEKKEQIPFELCMNPPVE